MLYHRSAIQVPDSKQSKTSFKPQRNVAGEGYRTGSEHKKLLSAVAPPKSATTGDARILGGLLK